MRPAALLGLVGALGAAGAAPVDCATLKVAPGWALRYQELERFPDPVKRVRLDLYALTKPFSFAACGVRVTADARRLVVRAKTAQQLLQYTGEGLGWTFPLYGIERGAGGQPRYQEAAYVYVSPAGLVQPNVEVRGTFSGRYLPDDALMAVRVNGGGLKPLLFNGRFRDVDLDPKLDTLEILAKSSRPVLWARVTIDTRAASLTLDKAYPFPAR